jgi:flagellar biosynthesis protein FlhA
MGARGKRPGGEQARDREGARKQEEAKNSVKELAQDRRDRTLIGKQLSTELLTSHQELAFRMGKMRKKFAQQYGFVVPESS